MNSEYPARRLRGATIGAGYFSQFHYDAWARMDQVELVACCDTDRSKAQQVADRYGIANVFGDYRRMLDDCKLDFVDIVTPPATHLGIVATTHRMRGAQTPCPVPTAKRSTICRRQQTTRMATLRRLLTAGIYRLLPRIQSLQESPPTTVKYTRFYGEFFAFYPQPVHPLHG